MKKLKFLMVALLFMVAISFAQEDPPPMPPDPGMCQDCCNGGYWIPNPFGPGGWFVCL